MKQIAPSILSADFLKLEEEIKKIENAGADLFHVDVMDGHFVPNISFGSIIVEAVKKVSKIPIDVHLMIENADSYIPDFAKKGADYISVHYEASSHLNRSISLIKSYNVKAGVVLNPSTPVLMLEDILEYVDFVLLMSVNPGFGGQKFIPNSIERIKKLKRIIEDRNLKTKIEIDGGVGEKNIKQISDAGVDIFVAGSSIFKSNDYKTTISKFKQLIEA